jgi:hypothetical protein
LLLQLQLLLLLNNQHLEAVPWLLSKMSLECSLHWDFGTLTLSPAAAVAIF